MPEIIDLSQEIYDEMPVYHRLPAVKISVHSTHEEWEGLADSPEQTPSVYKLTLSEHTGTHVDAINHMGKTFKGHSIDKMPLQMFYTEGICLDFSHKKLRELISSEDIKKACQIAKVNIQAKDTVLLYTDHYRRHFRTENWGNGPGITAEATRWLGNQVDV